MESVKTTTETSKAVVWIPFIIPRVKINRIQMEGNLATYRTLNDELVTVRVKDTSRNCGPGGVLKKNKSADLTPLKIPQIVLNRIQVEGNLATYMTLNGELKKVPTAPLNT